MHKFFIDKGTLLLFLGVFIALTVHAKERGKISGSLRIDDSWKSSIYLSFIPTYDDLYTMSNEMIIAETTIDSSGNYQFDIDFLPEEDKLFRLHLVKKGNSKSSLIIGGSDENHLFFVANRSSRINIQNKANGSPFRRAVFSNSSSNTTFQKITDMVYLKDSIMSNSGSSKRKFIENQFNKSMLNIADSSSNLMASLYAFSFLDLKFIDTNYSGFYSSYFDKWEQAKNPYLTSFMEKVPVQKHEENNYFIQVLLALLLVLLGYIWGKNGVKKKKRIKKLSIQERKVFELLKKGASNQEIADNCNIGLSTVKSHVSSILSKLNIKSRKDVLDFK